MPAASKERSNSTKAEDVIFGFVAIRSSDPNCLRPPNVLTFSCERPPERIEEGRPAGATSRWTASLESRLHLGQPTEDRPALTHPLMTPRLFPIWKRSPWIAFTT